MRVATYARFSSDRQKESSITDQQRNCQQRAAKEGWVIVANYEDHAISGTTEDRPGYQAMLKAAQQKEFDIVLVDDFSRLSRDSRESELTRRRLVYWGVRLVSISDGIDTALKGHEMMAGFKGIMNAQFIGDLRDRIHRGLTGKVHGGYHCGGRTYGYKLEPVLDPTKKDPYGNPERIATKLAIDEEQATWVRWIFARAAEGMSPYKIVSELNRQGVPAPGMNNRRHSTRPSAWNTTSLHGNHVLGTGLLQNQIYVGQVVWNRRRREQNPDTGIRVYVLRDPKEWITKPAPLLRIIDDDLWEKVKAARAAVSREVYALREIHGRARSTGRNPKYLFSGLLVCGICQSKFVVCSTERYGCATRRAQGATECSNQLQVRRHVVESALLTAIQKDLFTSEGLEIFKQEVVRLLANQPRLRRPDLAKARARLAVVQGELANVMQVIKDGLLTPTVKVTLEQLEAEKTGLEQVIAGKDKLFEKVITFLPNIEQRFKQLVDDMALKTQSQVDQARGLLKQLVGGQIRLHPSTDGPDQFLTAELSGDYAGLVRLASGPKFISNPLTR